MIRAQPYSRHGFQTLSSRSTRVGLRSRGRRIEKPWRTNAARWTKLRYRVFDRANWVCESCSKPGALECDHKKSRFLGGDVWAIENLQALCRGCHIAKTTKEVLEFNAARNPVSRKKIEWEKAAAELVPA